MLFFLKSFFFPSHHPNCMTKLVKISNAYKKVADPISIKIISHPPARYAVFYLCKQNVFLILLSVYFWAIKFKNCVAVDTMGNIFVLNFFRTNARRTERKRNQVRRIRFSSQIRTCVPVIFLLSCAVQGCCFMFLHRALYKAVFEASKNKASTVVLLYSSV